MPHKCNSHKKKSHKDFKVVFPGDSCPKKADFVIVGAGMVALPLAKGLTDQGFRVLMLEEGLDQSANTQVQEVFGYTPIQANDPAVKPGQYNLNIVNILFDPNISNTYGSANDPGCGYSTRAIWSGRGVGGSGLHYFCDAVRPLDYIFDTLPSEMVPPSTVPYSSGATMSLSDAGGPAWNSATMTPLVDSVENFNLLAGILGPPLTENPSERGYGGPVNVTQLDPTYPPTDEPGIVQNAMSLAALTVPGGAACPVVEDYNIPENTNSVSQMQYFMEFVPTANPPSNVLRQNAATGYANSSIVVPDGHGNLVGVDNRKLVIMTNRTVIRLVGNKCSGNEKYVASGVEFSYKNDKQFVKGRNVIVSAGASQTPQIYQRSGIGPAALLSKVGIPMQVNSPFVGQNLHNQVGGRIVCSTTNPVYSEGFLGQSFIQIADVPRRCQVIQLGLGPTAYGMLTAGVPYPDPSLFYFIFDDFMCNPRSRGYVNITQATAGVQADIKWGFFNDGPDPNDPASGLSDPQSDISIACASLDYTYNTVLNMQAAAPGDNIVIVSPPQSVFEIENQEDRWAAFVPYIVMNLGLSAHDAGTVVMNNDPEIGACDGNLKMHGTDNVFTADMSVFPTQSCGNPSSLLMAFGLNAANVIPPVAR